MSSLGAVQRTVRRNWASSPALAAGEGAGEGPWATGERFGCLGGVEAARVAGCAGSQERRPPRQCCGCGWAAPGLGRGEAGKEGECARARAGGPALIRELARAVSQRSDRRSSERVDRGTTSQEKHVAARTPRRLGARGPRAQGGLGSRRPRGQAPRGAAGARERARLPKRVGVAVFNCVLPKIFE
jgi:hypothetical protein